jgi:uncharacterized membrane protein YfcA
MARCILIGVLSAIGGAFLVAPLLALVYQFPIPFAGMESGPGAALRSLFAKVAGADRGRAGKLAVAFGLGAALAAECALLVADLIEPGL